MYRITEAARALGVHPDTLRNLERRGLVRVQRDWAGSRRYSTADLDRLCALLYPAAPVTAKEQR
jgi:DNA-binding transcriptional MerR regulator